MWRRFIPTTFALAVAAGVVTPPVGVSPTTVEVRTVQLRGELQSRGRIGGLAVDPHGVLYAANFLDTVWRIDADGDVTPFADGIGGPSGVAVTAAGDVVVAGFFDHTLRRITPDGTVTTIADRGLAAPVGVVEGSDGELYVCNCGDDSIVRVTPEGRHETFASGELFACPNGITRDPAGDLYVVSFNNQHVVRIDRAGRASIFATLPPGPPDRDGNPGRPGTAHVAFAGQDLYVTRAITHDVYRVAPDGGFARVAGTGSRGLADGPGSSATLSIPNGIAASVDGRTLWVNNLVGTWRGDAPTTIVIRELRLSPEPARATAERAHIETARRGGAGQRIGALMEELERQGFAGAVLVARGDTVLHAGSYGLADAEAAKEVGPDTTFELMSVTKAFTALSVLQLEAEGRLRLTDSLDRHLGPLPEGRGGITIEQVLLHTAGLPSNGRDLDRASSDAWIRSLMTAPPAFDPGTDHAYSNPGYGLLALLVERVSGMPYREWLRERVFAPAGMERTAFTGEGPPAAVGYARTEDGLRPFPPPGPAIGVLGATGVTSTVRDLFRWKNALRDGLLLDDARVADMVGERIAGHGYGWEVSVGADGTACASRDGAWPSFESLVVWCPGSDRFLAMTANSYGEWRTRVREGIDRILGGPVPGSSSGVPAASAPAPVPGQAASADGISRITIAAAGMVFDARVAGPENGEPVILLHGFPETSYAFRHQIGALAAAGYRAIAPDQRGYSPGARPDSVDAYAMRHLVSDVAAIAGSLGLDRFHLVGHDWGGAVAWVVAASLPDRIRSLTVLSTPHVSAFGRALADAADDQAERSAYFADFSAEDAEQRFLADDAAFLRSLLSGLDPAAVEIYVDALGTPEDLRGALNWYRASRTRSRTTATDASGAGGTGAAASGSSLVIHVPTLYVWGERDSAFGRGAAEATAEFIEGEYRFVPLAAQGHWLMELAADPVNELLLDHLARH